MFSVIEFYISSVICVIFYPYLPVGRQESPGEDLVLNAQLKLLNVLYSIVNYCTFFLCVGPLGN